MDAFNAVPGQAQHAGRVRPGRGQSGELVDQVPFRHTLELRELEIDESPRGGVPRVIGQQAFEVRGPHARVSGQLQPSGSRKGLAVDQDMPDCLERAPARTRRGGGQLFAVVSGQLGLAKGDEGKGERESWKKETTNIQAGEVLIEANLATPQVDEDGRLGPRQTFVPHQIFLSPIPSIANHEGRPVNHGGPLNHGGPAILCLGQPFRLLLLLELFPYQRHLVLVVLAHQLFEAASCLRQLLGRQLLGRQLLGRQLIDRRSQFFAQFNHELVDKECFAAPFEFRVWVRTLGIQAGVPLKL